MVLVCGYTRETATREAGPAVPEPTHTPIRNVRVDAQTWETAKAVAAARGETLSEVIRTALDHYIARHTSGRQTTGGKSSPVQPSKRQEQNR